MATWKQCYKSLKKNYEFYEFEEFLEDAMKRCKLKGKLGDDHFEYYVASLKWKLSSLSLNDDKRAPGYCGDKQTYARMSFEPGGNGIGFTMYGMMWYSDSFGGVKLSTKDSDDLGVYIYNLFKNDDKNGIDDLLVYVGNLGLKALQDLADKLCDDVDNGSYYGNDDYEIRNLLKRYSYKAKVNLNLNI